MVAFSSSGRCLETRFLYSRIHFLDVVQATGLLSVRKREYRRRFPKEEEL
jgi:hypothetical protein